MQEYVNEVIFMSLKRFWSEVTDTGVYYYNGDKRIFPEDFLSIMNELYDKNIDLVDEYHTMEELYDFRMIYNALLFNEWYKYREDIEVYKSKRHHDGRLCFDGNWFIVVAILPNGEQVTNHYKLDYWDYFKIPSFDKVKDEFDGHSSQDVIDRLSELILDE